MLVHDEYSAFSEEPIDKRDLMAAELGGVAARTNASMKGLSQASETRVKCGINDKRHGRACCGLTGSYMRKKQHVADRQTGIVASDNP